MERLSAEEAREAVASNEVEVIDLRDAEAWAPANIPGSRRAGDDLEETLEGIDSDRKLLIVCADGERSAEVAEELNHGDREAVSLEGGIGAWESQGLRTSPSEDYVPPPSEVE